MPLTCGLTEFFKEVLVDLFVRGVGWLILFDQSWLRRSRTRLADIGDSLGIRGVH